MSYIEKKRVNDNSYYYFSKKFSIMKKQYKISKYIGNKPVLSKENFLKSNLEEITRKEFEIKKELFPKEFNKHKNFENNELLSIKINNYLEAENKDFEIELLKEFVYNSNNIEGSKIPKKEVDKLFENKKTNYNNKNEILEIENSIKAYKYIKNEFNFSIRSIKKLYSILTKNLIMETGDKYPKGLRKTELVVGNEKTCNYKEIEKEMNDLLIWYKKNKNIHPLKLAFDFHLLYESIHPFRDANGRTGRLIMNKILIDNNYPQIIVFKDNKEAYFNSIKKARDGKKEKYYYFMLEQQEKTYLLLKNLLKIN